MANKKNENKNNGVSTVENSANVCDIANNATTENTTALTVSIGGITRIENKLNIEQRKMLSVIAVKYGDGAKNASRSIMAMQNVVNAIDIATAIEVYNAIESIKKKTNKLNGAVKEWSNMTGIEYTKVSKLQSIYTTIYSQLDDTIQHEIVCDIATTESEQTVKKEVVEESKMQYLSRFTYSQLVEIMALKREEIRYIVEKASEIYTLTVANIRFCVGAFKDSTCVDEKGEYTDDRQFEFINRYEYCINGGKISKYFKTEDTEDKKGDNNGDNNGENIISEKYNDTDKEVIKCMLDMIKDGTPLEEISQWLADTVTEEQTEEQTEAQTE